MPGLDAPRRKRMRRLRVLAIRMAGRALAVRRRLLKPVTLGVRILLVRDGEVLLVRHTYMSGWYLPGGGLRRRETLEAAIRREAREEVGASFDSAWQLAAFSNFEEALSDHLVVFVAEGFTLSPATSDEIAEARFSPLTSLPPGTSAGTRKAIAYYLARL